MLESASIEKNVDMGTIRRTPTVAGPGTLRSRPRE